MIHLYFGNGKGKTTAAVGMAVRAAGNGKNVVFVQFMKGADTGEIGILRNTNGISVLRSTEDFGFFSSMGEDEKFRLKEIHNGLIREGVRMAAGENGFLVLDEITHAVNFGLIDENIVFEALKLSDGGTEVVMTGRDPNGFMLECADYISEIKKVKHPFDKGIGARKGVEF